MKRFKIFHLTHYDFSEMVELQPHALILRPREGHELRIESSRLEIYPSAQLKWHRDVEGNSIAIATFEDSVNSLEILSEVIIQKYDENPFDFLVSDYAINFPFSYSNEDKLMLSPYMAIGVSIERAMERWISQVWSSQETIRTLSLLLRLNQLIFNSFEYEKREEEGVQIAEYTIESGRGTCRDFANLLMVSAQHLGFAARFVSGYIFAESSSPQSGSTHAWAEVYIPGAGWKGFDPTFGVLVGEDHISVAVSRRPDLIPPVSGKYFGSSCSTMSINISVTDVGATH